MNLNAYDNIQEKIDKTKSWVDIKRKLLISREIKYRPYFTIMKRYNPDTGDYIFFIALLDSIDKDKICKSTKRDNYGRVKIYLTSIWNDTVLSELDNNCNIDVVKIEGDDDGDIYRLDI